MSNRSGHKVVSPHANIKTIGSLHVSVVFSVLGLSELEVPLLSNVFLSLQISKL